MRNKFLFLFFSLIIISPFVLAGWPLGKQATCEFLNTTTMSACDELWCGIIDCNYNSTLSACVCQNKNSIIQSLNSTPIQENLSKYYNKSEIDIFNNQTETTILNITSTIKVYIDNQIKTLRDNLVDRIENATYKRNNPEETGNLITGSVIGASDSSVPAYVWVAIILAAMGLIGYLAHTTLKARKFEKPKPAVRSPYKVLKFSQPPPSTKEDINELKSEENDFDEEMV